MPNAHLTTTHAKHRALANSVGPQLVAHKSTGGIVNSFPEPVDPVGNASHRLTNHTVALPACGCGPGPQPRARLNLMLLETLS